MAEDQSPPHALHGCVETLLNLVLMLVMRTRLARAGAEGVAAEYLAISLPGQQKVQKATPPRSDSGTPFALLTSAATQLQNSHTASPARRPLAFDGSTPMTGPATSSFTLPSSLPASVRPRQLCC